MAETTPAARVAGPEHFSELADVRTPENQIPRCKKCHKPSDGAQIIEMLPGAMSGGTLMQVEFFCHDDGPGMFQVMSYALYPNYEVRPLKNDQYILRRLSREQAIARVKASKR